MKILSRVFALAALAALGLINTGCSKEEAAEPAAAATAAVEVETAEAATETAESSAPATETLEVVEESAAVAEPEDRAILLAQADANDTAAPARIWKYKEGEHYTRLIPTQGTVGGADKIEVAEVFMYSCPHCYTLEPYINQWAENKDPNVRLVRIPAIFNQLALMHAQLYYTEFYLAQTGILKDQLAFREMVFEEFHRRGNRLTSEDAIRRLFTRAGVSEEDFNRTWGSFEVNQSLRVAQDLARRYGIASVPKIVVNGKYTTDVGTAGGYSELLELIDELTAREGIR
jgi:protein dithiol oxidoreductase (disulfide-forming)